MFNHQSFISPFSSHSVPVNTRVPDVEAEEEVAEMNEEYDEPVAVKPKKVKHRLPGIRLLRELEKQRLKELEKEEPEIIEEQTPKKIFTYELDEDTILEDERKSARKERDIAKLRKLRDRLRKTLN